MGNAGRWQEEGGVTETRMEGKRGQQIHAGDAPNTCVGARCARVGTRVCICMTVLWICVSVQNTEQLTEYRHGLVELSSWPWFESLSGMKYQLTQCRHTHRADTH